MLIEYKVSTQPATCILEICSNNLFYSAIVKIAIYVFNVVMKMCNKPVQMKYDYAYYETAPNFNSNVLYFK